MHKKANILNIFIFQWDWAIEENSRILPDMPWYEFGNSGWNEPFQNYVYHSKEFELKKNSHVIYFFTREPIENYKLSFFTFSFFFPYLIILKLWGKEYKNLTKSKSSKRLRVSQVSLRELLKTLTHQLQQSQNSTLQSKICLKSTTKNQTHVLSWEIVFPADMPLIKYDLTGTTASKVTFTAAGVTPWETL